MYLAGDVGGMGEAWADELSHPVDMCAFDPAVPALTTSLIHSTSLHRWFDLDMIRGLLTMEFSECVVLSPESLVNVKGILLHVGASYLYWNPKTHKSCEHVFFFCDYRATPLQSMAGLIV